MKETLNNFCSKYSGNRNHCSSLPCTTTFSLPLWRFHFNTKCNANRTGHGNMQEIFVHCRGSAGWRELANKQTCFKWDSGDCCSQECQIPWRQACSGELPVCAGQICPARLVLYTVNGEDLPEPPVHSSPAWVLEVSLVSLGAICPGSHFHTSPSGLFLCWHGLI